MMKAFVYPTVEISNTNLNPYINNLTQSLTINYSVITPKNKFKFPPILIFLLQSWKADIYILNWIENAPLGKLGFIGAWICLLGLRIVKIRKKKIIWIFHNIHPHEGDTFWSNKIKSFLYNNSTFIISHSKEGTEFAKQYAKCPVYFKNHPMKKVKFGEWDGKIRQSDFFFWSTVLPYKGLKEFLSNPLCRKSSKKILAIGKCNDPILSSEIEALTDDNIIFENRTAPFSEIAAHCKNAKYVIFPYIGESISSSGVLMDTLLMGGTPVGPNKGAFADLAKQGCCITYDNINDIFNLPMEDKNLIKLNPKNIENFIDENTWEAFGHWLYNLISTK